nr:hypothetical protein [Endozoicomonas sp. YOMI1]
MLKEIVDRLKEENRSEAKLHRKVYRPWGLMTQLIWVTDSRLSELP